MGKSHEHDAQQAEAQGLDAQPSLDAPANGPEADHDGQDTDTDEVPDWLDEAFEDDDEEQEDTGAAEPSDSSGTEHGEASPPTDDTDDGAQDGADQPDTTTDDNADGKDEAQDQRPPDRYVPIGALHEERSKRQDLQRRLEELETRVQKAGARGEEKAEKPASVDIPAELQAELTALERRSPEAAAIAREDSEDGKLLREVLSEYGALDALRDARGMLADRRVTDAERRQEQAEATRMSREAEDYISGCMQRISEAVPGAYDEGSAVPRELAQFAMDNGMHSDFLAAVTNPGTLIQPPGSEQVYYMGDGAVGVWTLLHTLSEAGKKATDPETLQKELRAELEQEITQRVTKELTQKFKGAEASGYRSLGDGPGSGDTPLSGADAENMSEEEWARLPETERERLLKGE
ncbi:hypothetical protein [Desulfobaculum sp.]